MRFVFFSIPQHGHINPTLPIARELLARGHSVVYYLTDDFEGMVRAAGAEFRSLGSFDVDAEVDRVLGPRRAGGVDLSTGVTVLLGFVARMLRATHRSEPRSRSTLPT